MFKLRAYIQCHIDHLGGKEMQKEIIDLIERLQEGCYNHAASMVYQFS